MNAGTKRGYLAKICESLVAEYGGTLVDSDTDLSMAKRVFRKLKPFLSENIAGFLPELTLGEFKEWRRKFLLKPGYEDPNDNPDNWI